MLQRDALEKFHGDEGLAILFADVVDGADVGMIERGGGLSFALKARQCLGIAGNSLRQEFQRYEGSKTSVLGLIDHAHPTAAEFLDDLIVRDGLSDERRGI